MQQNKFTFEFQNLAVDWIFFKFQKFDKSTEREITNYLFWLGFNSYQEAEKSSKPTKQFILVNYTNKYQVVLVHKLTYWEGITINFSGHNASFFYLLIRKNLVNCQLFSSGILSRFDLCYFRKNKTQVQISCEDFFEKSDKNLRRSHKNVRLEKNKNDSILSIGSRKSHNYSRI
jgi:hypothetical protein